jgi:predicted enzyme related to lactoylglutathione lyase
MRNTIVSCLLLAGFVTCASAQEPAAQPAAPQFVQASTNVFRRFAVDVAKMKEFYGDVLGLQPLPTLNMPGGGQMTRFHAGTSEIKLQASPGESKALVGGVKDFTGLRVLTFFFPDDAALTARFTAHGLPAPQFQQSSAQPSRVALVKDPSDQWVELVAMPGAPPATYERLEVGLTVTDLDRSRAFYREFVGLEELMPVSDPVLGVTKYPYRLGTTTISLWTSGKTVPGNRTSAGIQYVVGNVAAIDARAKERGVQIDRPLGPFGTGLRTVWMSDPDGITNYFAQVTGRTVASTER